MKWHGWTAPCKPMLSDRFATDLNKLHPFPPAMTIGLAVSGGGDSMALLDLTAEWAAPRSVNLKVASVNHGLRPDAAAEIALVAARCHALGLPHETLDWEGNGQSGNLQANARQARQRLINNWAQSHAIKVILTGHTLDDLGETFLMRLARGSGVDGLAAMRQSRLIGDILWLRPLLRFNRQELRDWLVENHLTWADDPSNEDPRFDRVRFRQKMPELAALGLTPERLSATAAHMARAAEALGYQTSELARQCAALTPEGALEIDWKPLRAAPDDIQLRLLAGAIRYIAQSPYRPRFDALTGTFEALQQGRQKTLAGTVLTLQDATLTIRREPAAVQETSFASGCLFDNRWEINGPSGAAAMIRPLRTADLQLIGQSRDPKVSASHILATPAIWQKDELVAVPTAGIRHKWSNRLVLGTEGFISSLLSH